MPSLRSDLVRASLLALGLVLVGVPALRGQELRDVVSKEVAVGRDEAVLRLGLDDGEPIEIALSGGDVMIGDRVVGSYEPGSTLDAAWRTLLGTAVALEDGPLARALVAWEPPEGLDGDARRVAGDIDQALDQALARPARDERPAPPATPAPSGLESLSALLSRVDRLTGLAHALDGLPIDNLHLSVDEDLVIEADRRLEGTVVVVDGDLDVAGLIEGDVVVLGGDVTLLDGGRITGDLRYLEGRVVDRGGEVEGDRREMERAPVVVDEAEIRDRIREEVRSATREMARAPRASRDRGWSPFRRVFEGLGAAVGNLFTVLVLGIAGGVALYFAGPRVDVVADVARRSPGRAAMVGAAGAFLVFPAWLLGTLALVITIIGIPALILWVPLFPVAVIVAAAVGYVAVARNVGAWVSRQGYPYMDWVRVTNPYSLVFAGVLTLMIPFIAGNLLSMVPFVRAVHGFLIAAGVVATIFAVLVGFGALILTRGGRPNGYWDDDFFSSTGGLDGGGWSGPDPTSAGAPARGAEGEEPGATTADASPAAASASSAGAQGAAPGGSGPQSTAGSWKPDDANGGEGPDSTEGDAGTNASPDATPRTDPAGEDDPDVPDVPPRA
jgi:hypothetical protein